MFIEKKYTIGIGVLMVCTVLAGGVYTLLQTQRDNLVTAEDMWQEEKSEQTLPAWKTKIQTDQTLRIGNMNDTQFHPSRIDKTDKTPEAKRYIKDKYRYPMDAFVSEMGVFQPDFLVMNGDIIEGTNDEDYVGIQGLELMKDIMDSLSVPTYWTIGNHELRSVTREQYMQALDIDYLNTYFDQGDYRIILLDTNYFPDNSPVTPQSDRYIRGFLNSEGLEFLEESLQTDKQTIVFMHHPPFVPEDNVPDKYDSGLLFNAQDVQILLEKYNALAVFGGHIERKYFLQKEGVSYYAFPGTRKSDDYQGSFYEVVIQGEDVSVMMYYKPTEDAEYIQIDFETEEVIE